MLVPAGVSGPSPRQRFAVVAREVAGRWLTERDTRLETREVEAARLFLAGTGVPTTALPDGCFRLETAARPVLSRERLFVLPFRRLGRLG